VSHAPIAIYQNRFLSRSGLGSGQMLEMAGSVRSGPAPHGGRHDSRDRCKRRLAGHIVNSRSRPEAACVDRPPWLWIASDSAG
jgi:hypothetical protein